MTKEKLNNDDVLMLRDEYFKASLEKRSTILEYVINKFEATATNIVNAEYSYFQNEREDLINIGREVIWTCFVSKWDPSRAGFDRCINFLIRNAIRKYLDEHHNNPINVKRSLRNKAKKYSEALGPSPTNEEIKRFAKENETTSETVKYLLWLHDFLEKCQPNSDLIEQSETPAPNSDVIDRIARRERNARLENFIRKHCDNESEYLAFKYLYDPFDEGYDWIASEVAYRIRKTDGYVSRCRRKILKKMRDSEQEFRKIIRDIENGEL